jgi:hypothetical protein
MKNVASAILLTLTLLAGVTFCGYPTTAPVISPGEGVRLSSLPDGTYEEVSGRNIVFTLTWDHPSKQYIIKRLDQRKEEPGLVGRVTVVALKGPYYLAQIEESEVVTLLVMSLQGSEIVIHSPSDSVMRKSLADKHGIEIPPEGDRPMKAPNPGAMRAFYGDLAASGTLEPTGRYRLR